VSDVKLYLGDCLDVMREMPTGSVNAVVTDPPYSSGGAFRSDRAASTSSKYLGAYGKPPAVEHEFSGDSRDGRGWAMWATLCLGAAYRLATDEAFCMVFTDWRQLPGCTDVIQAAGWVWRGIVVWDKVRGRPMAGRFSHQAEYVVWGTKGPVPWDYSRPCLKGVYTGETVPAKGRLHQTEKPVGLMEHLLAATSSSAIVLDPFMGSGTTGVACVQTGRNFIGIEIDPTYFAIAEKRIKEAQMQQTLDELL